MRRDVPAAPRPTIEPVQPKPNRRPARPTPPQPQSTPAQQAPLPPQRDPSDHQGAHDGPYHVTPHGTKYMPSARPRGAGADFDNARHYFHDPGISGWVAKMHTDPALFTNLLSDIFRETRAQQERQAGQAKIGRRPRVIEGSLSELWDMITPKYAVEPFGAALKNLVGPTSPAEFAHRTMISPDTYRHMLAGEKVDMWRLEVIARAYGVSPAYFAEWRHSYVLTVVEELLQLQPNLSIGYSKALAKVVGQPKPSRESIRQSRRKPPMPSE